VLYPDTILGQRCLIHAGAALGAYGFGYKVTGGAYALSAQLGWVEVGDDVEIGAGTAIDRGTYGPTVIGSGTKIDAADSCRNTFSYRRIRRYLRCRHRRFHSPPRRKCLRDPRQ
jgi:hypothetical protein